MLRHLRRDPVLKIVLAYVLFILLSPVFTMLLWNELMPTLFQLPEIGFWHSVGLMLLSTLLFYRG